MSVAVTCAPRRRHSRAAATPLAPSPTIATRFPERITLSPKLQARQADEGQQYREDPETDDDLRLGPPLLFVVMVDGGHEENALARELERTHLNHHAHRLEEEDAAENAAQELVLREDGAHPEPAAERKRADVPHEDLRRIRVVPKEANPRPDDRPAENAQFADAGDGRNIEVAGDDETLGHIGDAERRAGEVGPDEIGRTIDDD